MLDRLATAFAAALVVVDDAGHLPHVERPEAFARLVGNFLGEGR